MLVLAVATLAFTLPASALGANLRGTVGPAFTISLVDEAGQAVSTLAAGTHTVTVRDLSEEHNFHLSGPGVNQSTGVEFVGEATWSITVATGVYTFLCDPHATQMRGQFSVGGATNPQPPPPPAPTPTRKLTATVGPGFTISIKSGSNAAKTVKAGLYAITVRDRSASHNIHLTGPGLNKRTSVAFRGTTTWRVRLRKGTYRFICDPHKSRMKGSFRVS